MMRILLLAGLALLIAAPATAQANRSADCIRFENIAWKPLEEDEDSYLVEVTWKVDMISECTATEHINVMFEFLDDEGFRLDYRQATIATIKAGQTLNLRGTLLMEQHKLDDIETVIATATTRDRQ